MVEYVGLVEKGLECPGYLKARQYIKENKKLPSDCSDCYTVTIWTAAEDVERFDEFWRAEFEAVPKEKEFKRIYVRLKNKEDKNAFIQEYREKLKNQGIEAKIDWGRCCGKIKKGFPSLFKGAKKLSEGMQLKLFNE